MIYTYYFLAVQNENNQAKSRQNNNLRAFLFLMEH